MAISVADNFSYLGTKPLDARVSFDTVSAMASASEATLYDGCFAYVKATQKYYSYDSTNTVDPTTGKWREYSSGGGGSNDYPDLTNKPSINGVELLGNKVIGLLSTNIQVDSDKIGYDNLTSELSATNVKSAIDELKSDIDNIQVTPDADDVSYDNTTSGMTATDVQGAIDELKSDISQSSGKGQSGTGTNSEIFNDYTNNTASGNYSHAEGYDNDAIGMNSHAEGGVNTATGDYSHAEGQATHAKALGSHSSGLGTIASVNYETAVGKYNVDESGTGASTRFVVGNGADQNNRSDAFKVTDTEIHMNGDIKHDGSNLITASTTDITAGTTALTTGNIYLVYE